MDTQLHNAIVEYWARGLTTKTASTAFNTLVCRIHGVTLQQIQEHEIAGHRACEEEYELATHQQHTLNLPITF